MLRIELQTAVGYLYARRSDALIGMCTTMSFTVTELTWACLRPAAQSSTESAWNAIFELVRSMSEVLSSSLPTFWRISKVLMRGKIKRVNF